MASAGGRKTQLLRQIRKQFGADSEEFKAASFGAVHPYSRVLTRDMSLDQAISSAQVFSAVGGRDIPSVYEVQGGDTLEGIARANYGDPRAVFWIIGANPGKFKFDKTTNTFDLSIFPTDKLKMPKAFNPNTPISFGLAGAAGYEDWRPDTGTTPGGTAPATSGAPGAGETPAPPGGLDTGGLAAPGVGGGGVEAPVGGFAPGSEAGVTPLPEQNGGDTGLSRYQNTPVGSMPGGRSIPMPVDGSFSGKGIFSDAGGVKAADWLTKLGLRTGVVGLDPGAGIEAGGRALETAYEDTARALGSVKWLNDFAGWLYSEAARSDQAMDRFFSRGEFANQPGIESPEAAGRAPGLPTNEPLGYTVNAGVSPSMQRVVNERAQVFAQGISDFAATGDRNYLPPQVYFPAAQLVTQYPESGYAHASDLLADLNYTPSTNPSIWIRFDPTQSGAGADDFSVGAIYDELQDLYYAGLGMTGRVNPNVYQRGPSAGEGAPVSTPEAGRGFTLSAGNRTIWRRRWE